MCTIVNHVKLTMGRGITCGCEYIEVVTPSEFPTSVPSLIIHPMRLELVQEMKRLVSFGESDEESVRSLGPRLRPLLPRVVERFYERLLAHPEARAVFTGGEEQMARQRDLLARWLENLFAGTYDEAYFSDLLKIGVAHVRTSVPQQLMVTGMEIIRQELFECLVKARSRFTPEQGVSLQKLLTLNLTMMLESYKENYETLVRKDERSAVEEKLTRAEHLAEIGQLAASLAHEIKNPLAGISGAIQIIRESLGTDDPHRPILTEVLGQIRRLDATVKDLLQYARPIPPRLKRCTVGDVIKRITGVLREEPALQNVRIEHAGITDGTVIMADENQIEQLLLNLIINAAHASREGDRIVVDANPDGEHVDLIVRDFGAGMSSEVRHQAFEPFFTTKSKGTGLGLSICRRIVEAHGGTMSMESEHGRGTTVYVRLPRGRTSRLTAETS